MNYRDYLEIMESEELIMPEIGEYELKNATFCQNVIKRLKKETNFDCTKQIKQMEEKKIGHILEAIEWARAAKENPDGFKWADRQLNRKRRI